MRAAAVSVQAATFVILAVLLWREGDPRLAAAQALLAAITVLVYL
jgi:hypothetical protein